jgi:UDP-N-acetylmuramyl pentapeptide phosphotransferase/UDP-N-acetylglucosamine-1-phosphate transferase
MSWGRVLRRAVLAGAGAIAAQGVQQALRNSALAPDLERTNFHGRTVSLAGGPALAISASVTSAAGARNARTAAAALVAGLGSGAVGAYDDAVGMRPEHKAKGFRGHLGALREGRVTSGLVKIAGVGAAGFVAAALLPKKRAGMVNTVLGAGVIAGSANLFNLLDLRPGRALKAGIIVGTPLAAGRTGGMVAGPLGAAAGSLGPDLGEETMLGDCGANAFGALLGTAFAARTGVLGKLAALAVIGGLTAASEKVSFTKVIERTPALKALDDLGRLREAEPTEKTTGPDEADRLSPAE